MSYITQPTPTQSRQNARDLLVLRVAEAVNHLASTLVSVNKEFYSVDSEQLVSDLNADLENSLSLMTANLTLGTVVNDHLDALNLPKYTKRVPLEISDPTITMSEEGFVYTEPVVED
jgi:hypothetical protein